MKKFENQELRDITESDIQKIIEIVKVLEKRDSAHIMSHYNNYNFSNNYVLGDYTEEETVKALFFPNTELKENLKELYNFSIVKTEKCGGYVRYYLLYTYNIVVNEKIIKTMQECEVLDMLDYYNYDERQVYNDYQSNIKEYQAQLNALNTVRLNFKKDGSERKDKLKNIIYNLNGVISNDKYIYSPFLEYNEKNKCRIVFESFGNNNYFTFDKSIDDLTLTEILEEIEKDKKRLTENIKDFEERKKTIKKDVAAYLEARKKLDEFGMIRSILGR